MYECPHCNVFPYETRDDLDSHLASRHSGGEQQAVRGSAVLQRQPVGNGFVRQPNGFGGTTTVRERPARPVNAPSEKQTSFVRSLLDERAGVPAAEKIRALLNQHREARTLDRQVVSNAITQLLAIPRPQVPATDTVPEVPEGRYAFTNDVGETAFCKVDHGKNQWAGRVFVQLLVGSPGSLREMRIDNSAQKAILAKLAIDPKEAMVRFGHELGTCGRCNSPLTDPESRAAGIGPVCATKL